MKQIIGYMRYDYINIKYGLWYMMLIFTVVSAAFSVKSSMGAIGYMLFGGLILSSTAFNTMKQTVSFTALVPGSTIQKVLGRYLGGICSIILCAFFGTLSAVIVKAAGCENGTIDVPLVTGLIGIAFVFLALQNVMLYLLTPILGSQFVGLIRMLPGFIMFFALMGAGNVEIAAGITQHSSTAGAVLLAAGVVSLIIAICLSCLIIRNRDNE